MTGTRKPFFVLALIVAVGLLPLVGHAVPATASFTRNPADAKVNAVISSVAFTPNGATIQVTGLSGTVSIAIDATSPNPGVGAALSGTTSVQARNGVATFGDLKIDVHGVYVLRAFTNTAFALSTSFQIWDDVDACNNNNGQNPIQCHGSFGQLKQDLLSSDISGSTPAGSTGIVATSFGVDDLTGACGDSSSHLPTTITFATSGLVGAKTAAVTVSKNFDQKITGAENGASKYDICYSSPNAFRAKGATATDPLVNLGLLPDCSTSPSDPIGPPCVVSRNKVNGNVVIVLSLPDSDPKML